MTEHRVDLTQLRTVRDGSGHSIFGASGYAHFLLCHGALIPNLLVHDPGNPDAAYGTVAHAVTEMWGKTGHEPVHLIGTTQTKDGFEIEIDEEMLMHAGECVDRCEWEPGDHLWEEHVDYSDLTPIPNQGGTLDFAAMRPGRAVVVDHKFGKHEMIFAERNHQLMLYCYGLWKRYDWEYDFKEFVIRINQPRLDHFDEWVCTVEELLSFAAWAKEQMAIAWAVDAPRTPSDAACRYCKIAASCTANAMRQVALLEGGEWADESIHADDMEAFKGRLSDELQVFELYALEAGNLSTTEIAKLHKQSKTAIRFWAKLAGELFRRGQAGEPLKAHNLKLVEGRSKRQFIAPAKAEKMMLSKGVSFDAIYDQKIVSPAQAEKLLKQVGVRNRDLPELLEGLVYKPTGKATLASLSDRRPEIVDITDVAFGDESTETTEDEDM